MRHTVTEATDSASGSAGPSLNNVFRLLADERRRAVLRFLLGANRTTASTDEVVAHLLERDGGLGDEEALEIQLRHTTLPKLADAGVIARDERVGRIEYRGPAILESCLDLAGEYDG